MRALRMTMMLAGAGLLALGAPARAQVQDKAKEAAKATAEAAKATASMTKEAAVSDNTLTAAEKADGWRLLFDGQTLSGWRGYGKKDVPPGWKVVDGAISRVDKAGDLITTDQFENFELQIDFKYTPKANSGIFYRGIEQEGKPIYHSAPEYQIVDDTGHPDVKNGKERTTASNYALIAPSKSVLKPAGEWNTAKIVVNGAHVEHWLNGEKVVEYELWSPEWKKLVAASKFKEWPEYGMAKKGHIAVQDHGDEVAFKNIKIKVLKGGATN
jgi:Domain of Unknown Function (DUF1080)